jgi:hypothetical protein
MDKGIEKFPGVNNMVSAYLDNSTSEPFGDPALPPPLELSPKEERKLWLKIDLRLLPILGLMYLMSYMDRCAIVLFCI